MGTFRWFNIFNRCCRKTRFQRMKSNIWTMIAAVIFENMFTNIWRFVVSCQLSARFEIEVHGPDDRMTQLGYLIGVRPQWEKPQSRTVVSYQLSSCLALREAQIISIQKFRMRNVITVNWLIGLDSATCTITSINRLSIVFYRIRDGNQLSFLFFSLSEQVNIKSIISWQ